MQGKAKVLPAGSGQNLRIFEEMEKSHTSRFWFLAVILVIPLVYSTETIDPAFTLRGILLAALTIVTIIATRKQPLRLSPILYIWCTYAAFNIISIFVAVNSGEAIYQASIVLLYGGWLFASMQIMTKEFRPLILRTIAILGFITSFISLFQFFDIGFTFIPSWGIPGGTMTTKNLMSSFLFLTLPATLYITIIEKKAWGIFGLLTLTMSVFVVLISQTRAVWVGSSVAGFVAVVFFVLSQRRSNLWKAFKSQIRNSAIVIAVCVIAIFVFNVAPRPGMNEATPTGRAGSIANYSSDASAQARMNVWKKSMKMFDGHPVFGVGPGNWKIALPGYGLGIFLPTIQDGSVQWTEAHNDFIQRLCESGAGGGLAFLAFFLYGIMLSIRSCWNKGNNPQEAILSILIGASICGFAVISFFDFPNARVEHSMLFMIWLSLIPFTKKRGHRENREFALPSYAAIVLTLPALLLTIEHFTAEHHEKDILEARISQDWEPVIVLCNSLYNHEFMTVDQLSTPILYYKAEAEFMQGNYDVALKDNLAALKDHPNHFFTLNNIATNYVKLGNFQASEVFYRRALAISPNFEESLLNLAAVYFNQKQYDSAYDCVRKCDTTQDGGRAKQIARALWGHH